MFYKLDGTEAIKPTPFDAHEQVVHGPHTHSIKEGYKPADPVHTFDKNNEPVALHEYPKAIAHDKETGEPIIAKDEDHEAELREAMEEAK